MADPEMVAGVSGGGKLSAAEAVEVYAGGYRARLTSALGETYEACWRVLGDSDFFRLAKLFIARTPSLSHNLSDYGAGFADWLDSLDELDHAPFLGDLARFEWAFKEVFHRAPHAGLPAAALAAKTGPGSVLRFGGAVERISLKHRVLGIWKRDRNDDTPLDLTDWSGREDLLLYKAGNNDVTIRPLSKAENVALKAMMDGTPLADALETSGLDQAGTAAFFTFIAETGLVTDVG